MPTLVCLVDVNDGRTVVESLQVADGFWSRMIGWQFRRSPGPGHGLLLVPCSSIHTCFVRFALDVTLLDRNGRVVAVHKNVRPWRLVLPGLFAHAVLEVPAGTADFRVGQQLRAVDAGGIELPRSLQFLCCVGSPPDERHTIGPSIRGFASDQLDQVME